MIGSKEDLGARLERANLEIIQLDLVEAVSTMRRHAIIHPTRPSARESLPEGFARSCTRFLICNNVREIKVDQEIVKKDSEYLQKHAIVVYFAEGRQTNIVLTQWVEAIAKSVGAWVGLGRDLGKDFFQVLTRETVATQSVLMLTPHKPRWGTCILQTSTPGFDALRPMGLKVPT